MGLYDREYDREDDGPAAEAATERDARRAELLAQLQREHPRSAVPASWRQRIVCVGCGTVATLISPFGIDQLRAQMHLWQLGWRRDPDTQLDYCPPCAVAHNPPAG